MSTSRGCSCQHRAPAAYAPLTAADTVAEASRRPAALEGLKRLGVNHCCGAQLSLAEAAAAAGVSVDDLLTAVNGAALS